MSVKAHRAFFVAAVLDRKEEKP
jgi:hypothetical protein